MAILASAVLLALGGSPVAADPADDERRELGDNREEQRRLAEESNDIEQSIEQLEGLIVGLDVRIVETSLELTTAEHHLRWTRQQEGLAHVAAASAVVDEVRHDRLLRNGVRSAYVDPPDDATGGYLLAVDANEAGRREVLVGAALSSQHDQLDALRDVRARRESTQAAAQDAALLAESARREVLELQAELGRLRADHVATKETLVERLEEFQEELDALAEDEAALIRLIRRLEAEAARAAGTAPSSLIWPASGWVSSEFGPRWGRNHNGIDIAAATGTPVRAAAGGVVRHAEPLGSFGNLVIIDHGGGLATLYAHLHTIEVSAGSSVEVDQRIATVGSTGRSTGPHLHFEVRRSGTAENPRRLLG